MITNVTYTGDGSTKLFNIPFTYLSEDFVKIKVDGIPTSFTFASSTQAQIAVAPGLGCSIMIYRETQDTPLVTFANSSQLNADSLNITAQQFADLNQESKLTYQMVQDAIAASAAAEVAASSITEGRLNNVFYTSEYSTLALAVEAAGSGTLYVNSDVAITTNTTLAVDTIVLAPGVFNISSGTTLTISGSFSAGDYQVFSGDGIIEGLRSVSPHWFGAKGDGETDDTLAIEKAINVARNGEVNFTTASYVVGAITPFQYPVTLNFNNSIVYPDTTGNCITIDCKYYVSQTVLIKDLYFRKKVGTANPSSLILITGENNIVLSNVRAQGMTCTHSYVYSYTSVCLAMRDCVFETGTAPYAIYLWHVAGSSTVYATATDIDHCRVGSITGSALYAGSVDISIHGKSTFEGCTTGALYFPTTCLSAAIEDCYFEANNDFDISFGNTNPANFITAHVKGCYFAGADGAALPLTKIRVAGGVRLTAEGNLFRNGGINGAEPAMEYVGVGNTQWFPTAGYTGLNDVEIADAIRSVDSKHTVITGCGMSGGMSATRHVGFPSINYVGGVGLNTLPQGNICTVTLAGSSGLIMVDMDNLGTGALFFATHSSGTIIEVADPSSRWSTSDTGSGFCIFKSPDSKLITIKNYVTSQNITVNSLGLLTGAAFP